MKFSKHVAWMELWLRFFWALNGTVNSQNGILKLEIENAKKRSHLRPKVNWRIATPHFQRKNLYFYFSLYFEGSPPAEEP
jgi:hypothetical protein